MSNKKIEDVEGIGPAYGAKLTAAGIKDTDSLLAAAGKPAGRKDLAAKADIPEKLILKFANKVDLTRIKGIGAEYADLLEASGVDTVPELAQRVPANLAKKLAEVNDAKNLTRRVPAESEVERWVAEAKTLPRAIEY
ncbi:MAG: DUF4332 domain-containing protein [Perlucidibaca sp.]